MRESGVRARPRPPVVRGGNTAEPMLWVGIARCALRGSSWLQRYRFRCVTAVTRDRKFAALVFSFLSRVSLSLSLCSVPLSLLPLFTIMIVGFLLHKSFWFWVSPHRPVHLFCCLNIIFPSGLESDHGGAHRSWSVIAPSFVLRAARDRLAASLWVAAYYIVHDKSPAARTSCSRCTCVHERDHERPHQHPSAYPCTQAAPLCNVRI